MWVKPKGKASTTVFSPHIHAPFYLRRAMWDVVIAILPAGIAGVYFFGWSAFWVIALSVLTALITEGVSNKMMGRDLSSLADGSAVITGLLFAYNLPASAPWYVVVVGSAFAIGIAKMTFGGLGQNFMNPALAGRIFVLFAWPSVMINHWPEVKGIVNSGFFDYFTRNAGFDSFTGATPLNTLKLSAQKSATYWQLFAGNVMGSLGETSKLAILLGGIYLMVRKVITPVIPFTYIAVVALLSWIFGGLPLGQGWFSGDALYHILAGGLFLGAFFMATDWVTSPITIKGQFVFAVGLGIITVIIRLWGGYPEGVSFSIVLMNITVPLIDRWVRPRIYGK